MESFIEKARKELCYGKSEPFAVEDISVLLAYFLEEKIGQINADKILEILTDRNVIAQFVEQTKKDFSYADILSDRAYLSRVSKMIAERILSGRGDSPCMRIAPYLLHGKQIDEYFGLKTNFGLIFAAESIFFQDTVHALQTDAFVANKELNFLGVHVEWLTDSGRMATRALVLDERGLIKDVKFDPPVKLDIVQILHLPQNVERELHRKISSCYKNGGVIQVNPYKDASERADNKKRSYELWNQKTVLTPETELFLQSDSIKKIHSKLKVFLKQVQSSRLSRQIGIVVQPNRGTEGTGVKKFVIDSIEIEKIDRNHPIFEHINHILSYDDVLVREERGNVRYFNPREREKGYRNLTLRINVAYNGREFSAESGYAQISKDEKTFVTSRSHGGEIISIIKALSNLYYQSSLTREWDKFIFTNEDIDRVKKAAVNAAALLNEQLNPIEYIKFLGIDILLEVSFKSAGSVSSVIPVVLEANSRPAGLAQSYKITQMSEGEKPELMVTYGLFGDIHEISGVD